LLETEHTTVHFTAQARIDRPGSLGRYGAANWAVWVDGQKMHTGTARRVLQCNALPEWSTPDRLPIELNDGQLDTVVVGGAGRWWRWTRPLRLLGLVANAKPQPHRQGRTLLVESDHPLTLRVDGEPLAASRRVQIDILPRALDMAGSHVAVLDPHRFVDTTW
jgi:hypothetical protein